MEGEIEFGCLWVWSSTTRLPRRHFEKARVCTLLTPPGLRTLDNQGLLLALFDHVEVSVPSSFPGVSRAPLSHLPGSSGSSTSLATTYRQDVSVVQSFNSNAGERNSHSYTPFIFQYLFHGVA